MANNKSIQFLRGSGYSKSETLLAGQPYFDMTNNNLYVGNGSSTIANLTRIGVDNIPKYALDIGDVGGTIDITSSKSDADIAWATREIQIGPVVIVGVRAQVRYPAVDTNINVTYRGHKMDKLWSAQVIATIQDPSTSMISKTAYSILSFNSSSKSLRLALDTFANDAGTKCDGFNLLLIGSTSESSSDYLADIK